MKKLQLVIITILVVISYVVINNSALAQIGEPWILGMDSPLKQFKSGTKAENVKCQPYYFVPVIKLEDGSPACVTPQTAQKLAERKWTTLENSQTYPISQIKIVGLQQTYQVGQPITVTINYTGYINSGIEPDVIILDDNGTQVWTSCCFSHTETVTQHPSISRFNVQGPKIVKGIVDSDYPVINKTGTYTMIASLENKQTTSKFIISNEIHQTLSDFIPPPPLLSSPLPPNDTVFVNYTALEYAKRHNWGDTFIEKKYYGFDLQIIATISNALKFSCTVTDPTGAIHYLIPVVQNGTRMQIQYYVPVSDPDGNYVVAFNVVNGSNTSNIDLQVEGTQIISPPTPPALRVPPP